MRMGSKCLYLNEQFGDNENNIRKKAQSDQIISEYHFFIKNRYWDFPPNPCFCLVMNTNPKKLKIDIR